MDGHVGRLGDEHRAVVRVDEHALAGPHELQRQRLQRRVGGTRFTASASPTITTATLRHVIGGECAGLGPGVQGEVRECGTR